MKQDKEINFLVETIMNVIIIVSVLEEVKNESVSKSGKILEERYVKIKSGKILFVKILCKIVEVKNGVIIICDGYLIREVNILI